MRSGFAPFGVAAAPGLSAKQAVAALVACGKMGIFSDSCTNALMACLMQASLSLLSSEEIKSLTAAFLDLRVHHAPFLNRFVEWYAGCWSLRPAVGRELDTLIRVAHALIDLGFNSLRVADLVSSHLQMEGVTPAQTLGLLSALARVAHFTPVFREKLLALGALAESNPRELAGLEQEDLIRGFQVHLCSVFEAPPGYKAVVDDPAVKSFFANQCAFMWYATQEREKEEFRRSAACAHLERVIRSMDGWRLVPNPPVEVPYHVELTVDEPTAQQVQLVCVPPKDQLRSFTPIVAQEEDWAPRPPSGASASALARPHERRSAPPSLKLLFRSALPKVRH